MTVCAEGDSHGDHAKRKLFRNSPWSQDTGACPPTLVAQGGGDRRCSPTPISPKCSLEEALKGNPRRQCPSRQRPGGAEANTRQESRSSASWSGTGPRGGKITLTSSSTVTATNHDGIETSVVTSAHANPVGNSNHNGTQQVSVGSSATLEYGGASRPVSSRTGSSCMAETKEDYKSASAGKCDQSIYTNAPGTLSHPEDVAPRRKSPWPVDAPAGRTRARTRRLGNRAKLAYRNSGHADQPDLPPAPLNIIDLSRPATLSNSVASPFSSDIRRLQQQQQSDGPCPPHGLADKGWSSSENPDVLVDSYQMASKPAVARKEDRSHNRDSVLRRDGGGLVNDGLLRAVTKLTDSYQVSLNIRS